MNLRDKIVATRIINGNTSAFGSLIDTYKSRIFSYCLRMTNDFQESEDLTQEVFLKIYKNISGYDWHRAALSTWIYTITRHTCLNHIRDQKVKKSSVKALDDFRIPLMKESAAIQLPWPARCPAISRAQ